MKNTKILEMLNSNKLEELKALLQDEVYADTLNSKTGAKQRYTAMKKYINSIGKNDNNLFKRVGSDIDVQGEKYNCFIDGFTIVLTTEGTGELEKHNEAEHGIYFKINQMIPELYNSVGKIDYKEVLAEAKQNGYKYTKNSKDNKVLVKISNEHINVTLLEKAYSIIDNGETPELYIPNDNGKSPIVLKNSIGICLILPINIESINQKKYVIIEADIKNKKSA